MFNYYLKLLVELIDSEGGTVETPKKLSMAAHWAQNYASNPLTYRPGDIVWIKKPQDPYLICEVTDTSTIANTSYLRYTKLGVSPSERREVHQLDLSETTEDVNPERTSINIFRGKTVEAFRKKAKKVDDNVAYVDDAIKAATALINRRALTPVANNDARNDGDTTATNSDGDAQSDDNALSEEDEEILTLRKPFEDHDACLAVVKANEQWFRDIVAGNTASELFDQFRSEGENFRNPIAVGPFQNEDDQIEPITDKLKEWFPGRDNQTLREEVLLEEALLLIVQKITNVDRTAAEVLMQRPKWITSAERDRAHHLKSKALLDNP